MPITGITYQPKASSLNSVYRPLIFRCTAKIPNATADKYICPVVYCDVYVEGLYYKTLSRTQYIKNVNNNPEYEFDIQDAIQELMNYNLPIMDGFVIEKFENTIKNIFVKFRNSFSDTNGFVKSEQIEPVQGTSSNPPVLGGGTKSNDIYTLNSVIQHEESQDLDELLASYQTGSWSSGTLPLTKRPMVYMLCKNDSSHFPIVSTVEPKEICIKYKTITGEVITVCSDKISYCPLVENIHINRITIGPNQQFEITWTNPVVNNLTGIRIYWQNSLNPNTWDYQEYPLSQPVIITVNHLNPVNFKFMALGGCFANEFNDLPMITINTI